MPHPPRLVFDGAIYHITTRGNSRRKIFEDDVDHDIFLREFGVTWKIHGWICHSFCLMPNHFHLVLETPKANLSAGMQRLKSRYARIANQRHGRSDHLFRQRFRSRLIKTDAHMLEACRYVDLNPVRAGLCEKPEDWRWSSYRAMTGLAPVPYFLSTERVHGYFSRDTKRAQQKYADFVAEASASQSLADLDIRLQLAPPPAAPA